MNRRVVITGLGAVTPLAIGVEESWCALCLGKSGIRPVTRFDATGFRTRIAGEVKGFRAEDFMDRKVVRRMNLFIQFALAAARMAMEDSKLSITPDNAGRVGVVIGTALAGISTFEESTRLIAAGRGGDVSPFMVPGAIANMAAGYVALQYGARGVNMCPVTACAAGTHAVGLAFKAVQQGDADAVISGGAEAGITELMFRGLDALRATSPRNDEPEKASRPFEKDRQGFVVGEGAGVLVLEELGSALRRSAHIYAEVIGFGYNCDAYHITAPSPKGEGAAECMRLALADAGIAPSDVDYINAHGTGTVLNDASETQAIKSAFGGHARKLAVSSNKSMIGHLWGASGAVEAVFTALTLEQGILPPTVNYDTPDPQCDLDYVPNRARQARVTVAISNSFGFGGTNGCIVLKRFEG